MIGIIYHYVGIVGLSVMLGWLLRGWIHARALQRLVRRARERVEAKRVPDPDEADAVCERACAPERLPTLTLAKGHRR